MHLRWQCDFAENLNLFYYPPYILLGKKEIIMLFLKIKINLMNIVFLLVVLTLGVNAADFKAVECSPRNGLPNFFAKCKKGKTVRIAYLGGSITSQAGWRVQSLELFKKLYPNTKFEGIHAGIGGTRSDFGVYRLGQDVLRYKPDLLFVEFATNDGSRTTTKYMEGIVRNTWLALPDCDICFVYTVAGKRAQTSLENGKLYTAAAAHEKVARHYGVSSIHLGIEAARLAKAGKLEWKSPKARVEQISGDELNKVSGIAVNKNGKIPFSRDGVHPYLNTGHKLYTDAIKRSIPMLKKAQVTPVKHTDFPVPMNDDYMRFVNFFDASKADMLGQWDNVFDPSKGYRCKYTGKLPSLWKGKPGASLSFSFKGRSVLLYTLMGPGSGQIEVDVDGKKSRRLMFDSYSNKWRLVATFIARNLDPKKRHRIKIKILDEKVDKREIFKLRKRLKYYDSKPTKIYEPIDFVIGGICIEDGILLNNLK